VDFEALPSWHVYGYMPTTLQCIKDVLEARLVVGNPKKRIGNMVPWIYDSYVITYLQVGEILIRLTPKEWNRVIHWVKWFKWKSDSLLQVWIYGWIQIVFHLKQHEGLISMLTRSHFGVQQIYKLLDHNSERASYASLDRIWNRFEVQTETLID
jgi:hypothetical protein